MFFFSLSLECTPRKSKILLALALLSRQLLFPLIKRAVSRVVYKSADEAIACGIVSRRRGEKSRERKAGGAREIVNYYLTTRMAYGLAVASVLCELYISLSRRALVMVSLGGLAKERNRRFAIVDWKWTRGVVRRKRFEWTWPGIVCNIQLSGRNWETIIGSIGKVVTLKKVRFHPWVSLTFGCFLWHTRVFNFVKPNVKFLHHSANDQIDL